MKLLILGCNGQLGRCLLDRLDKTGYSVTALGKEELDIGDLAATNELISKIRPDVLINASAYTAVDAAENNQNLANHINNVAVANLAECCLKNDIYLIHISTDYVFDGVAEMPYKESDNVNPQSVYGRTKLSGEISIESSGCRYIIIRTAWIFSEYGNNFLKTMIRLGLEKKELSIVGDQIGCPTYGGDLAKAIIKIIPIAKTSQSLGIYHYSGAIPCTWLYFATQIFDAAKGMGFNTPLVLKEITTSDFPTPAKRPRYSVLDNSKIISKFNVQSSDWFSGIKTSLINLEKRRH